MIYSYISKNENYYGFQEPNAEQNPICICGRELFTAFSVQYTFANMPIGCNMCVEEKEKHAKCKSNLCVICNKRHETVISDKKTGELLGCNNCVKTRTECFF